MVLATGLSCDHSGTQNSYRLYLISVWAHAGDHPSGGPSVLLSASGLLGLDSIPGGRIASLLDMKLSNNNSNDKCLFIIILLSNILLIHSKEHIQISITEQFCIVAEGRRASLPPTERNERISRITL